MFARKGGRSETEGGEGETKSGEGVSAKTTRFHTTITEEGHPHDAFGLSRGKQVITKTQKKPRGDC